MPIRHHHLRAHGRHSCTDDAVVNVSTGVGLGMTMGERLTVATPTEARARLGLKGGDAVEF